MIYQKFISDFSEQNFWNTINCIFALRPKTKNCQRNYPHLISIHQFGEYICYGNTIDCVSISLDHKKKLKPTGVFVTVIDMHL